MTVQGPGDVRADSLQSVIDAVFSSPAYQWESRPDPLGPLRRLWMGLFDWLGQLRSENPEVFRLVTWALVTLLVLILLHAAWVAFRTIRGGSGRSTRQAQFVAPPPRDAAWYAAEAERLAANGRYAEAMQTDFLRLVLELEGRRVLRFHPSTTPSEYVRSADLSDGGRVEFHELVRRMYSYAFARVPCDRAAFESWRALASASRYAPAH